MKSLFVSVVLSCAAAFSPTAFSEIIIGQSAPLSGKNADMGNDIRRGAMAWFNSVNAKGGVNGQKITLITLDDGNDAKQAGENAKILVDKKHATSLFGFASATLSAPALPLVQQRGIAMFAPFSGADLLRKQTANVFTIRASYRDEMKGILDIWQGYFKTLVVVFYDDAVGKQNFEAVSEILRPSGFIPQGVAIKRNEKIGPEVTAKIESYKPQLILFTTLSDPL